MVDPQCIQPKTNPLKTKLISQPQDYTTYGPIGSEPSIFKKTQFSRSMKTRKKKKRKKITLVRDCKIEEYPKSNIKNPFLYMGPKDQKSPHSTIIIWIFSHFGLL